MGKKLVSFVMSMFILFTGTTSFALNTSTKEKPERLYVKTEKYEGSAIHPDKIFLESDSTYDIIPFENPPEYWKLAKVTRYNQTIRDITLSTIASALISIGIGSANTARSIAAGILGGAVGSSGSSTVWVTRTLYYKTNTDNNGYPYYCQEITEAYLDPARGTHIYTTVDYFYSYQPY